MLKRTNSNNGEKNQEPKQKKQKKEESMAQQGGKQEEEGTNSNNSKSGAEVIADYLKTFGSLEKWSKANLRECLTKWIELQITEEQPGDDVIKEREDFVKKFKNLDGAKLANALLEDVQKDVGAILGRQLWKDLGLDNKDQSNTTLKTTIPDQFAPIQSGEIPQTSSCGKVGSVVEIKLLRHGLNELVEARQLYVRRDCVKLWTELETPINSRNLLISGPPGTGKSSLVWAWCLRRCFDKEKKLRWIHLSGSKARVIDFRDGKYFMPLKDLEILEFKMFDDDDFEVVVLDGISEETKKIFNVVTTWTSNKQIRSNWKEKTRLILVSSLQFKMPHEERTTIHNFLLMKVSGWTHDEYNKACLKEDFWKSNKGIFDDLFSIPASTLDAVINKKIYYAGASARWMFNFNVKDLLAEISTHLPRSPNVADLMKGLSGDASSNAVNHLVTNFNGKSSIVSKYVMDQVCRINDISFIVEATKYIEDYGGSFSGWIFQADFLKHLKSNLDKIQESDRKITVVDVSKVQVPWKISAYLPFHQEAEIFNLQLVDECWLIPTKINQGCYDALQLLGPSQANPNGCTLRVVQITVAPKHDFKLQYVVSVLDIFQMKLKLTKQFKELKTISDLKQNTDLIQKLPNLQHLQNNQELAEMQKIQANNLADQITKLELCVVVPNAPGQFVAGKFYAATDKITKTKTEWDDLPDTDIKKVSITNLGWKTHEFKVFGFVRGQF